jgi:hypothetical protein
VPNDDDDDDDDDDEDADDERRPVRRADNLTTFMCRLSSNVAVSTSWNPKGLYRDCLTFLLVK